MVDGESGEEKGGLRKHGEIRKGREVGSRQEARHTEKSDQCIFREEVVGGRASVTT